MIGIDTLLYEKARIGGLMGNVLPSLVSSYNIMACRSAFSGIPEEVVESARIDAAFS